MKNLKQELISTEKIRNNYKIQFNCAHCNEITEKIIHKSKLEKAVYFFCSTKCSNSSQSTGVLRILIKEKFMKRYGVENISQLESIKKQKIETSMKNYGVPNAGQSLIIKQKRIATSMKNYGVKHPNQSFIVRVKTEQTCLKKYGKTSYLGSKECLDASKNKSLKLYGVEHFMQSQEFLNEIYYPAIFAIYGANNPMQNSCVVQKVRDTCMEKYGVDNALKTQLARDNFYNQLKNNNSSLCSKIENKFYENMLLPLCNKLGLTIEKQKYIKCWFIDFYIVEKELYIQFDGEYWHGINETIEVLKNKIETHGKQSLWNGVLKNKYKDVKQNKWFEKANKKLMRITDEEYLNNENEVRNKLHGILTSPWPTSYKQ